MLWISRPRVSSAGLSGIFNKAKNVEISDFPRKRKRNHALFRKIKKPEELSGLGDGISLL